MSSISSALPDPMKSLRKFTSLLPGQDGVHRQPVIEGEVRPVAVAAHIGPDEGRQDQGAVGAVIGFQVDVVGQRHVEAGILLDPDVRGIAPGSTKASANASSAVTGSKARRRRLTRLIMPSLQVLAAVSKTGWPRAGCCRRRRCWRWCFWWRFRRCAPQAGA